MVVVMVLVFSILETPTSLDRLMDLGDKDLITASNTFIPTYLSLINSSVNFVSYSVANKKFRSNMCGICMGDSTQNDSTATKSSSSLAV